MSFFKSILLAFSMFSAIPVPNVEWNEKNMRYMMCAFPFVGLVIALLCAAWFLFGIQIVYIWHIAVPIRILALIFMVIPILISGGIHFDGFMDTCDALASHAPCEKKLEILKDSHSGAFAILGCSIYLLFNYVFSCEFYKQFYGAETPKQYPSFFTQFIASLPVVSIFMISRLLSAFSVAAFPIAKNSGLVHTFSTNSARFFTAIWCEFFFILISIVLFKFYGLTGVAIISSSLLFFLFYYFMTKHNFGGITGDTAGWFVQLCELILLAVFVFAHILCRY